MILFDANILVHAHTARSPFHLAAQQLRDQVAQGAIEACVSPQVLCEFYSVVTNDRLITPALTPVQAKKELHTYWHASGFRKIIPRESTIPHLVKLLDRNGVKRNGIFDVFLVATMLDHGVHTIYTQNVKDFDGYPELHVINPLTSDVPIK